MTLGRCPLSIFGFQSVEQSNFESSKGVHREANAEPAEVGGIAEAERAGGRLGQGERGLRSFTS